MVTMEQLPKSLGPFLGMLRRMALDLVVVHLDHSMTPFMAILTLVHSLD
jgi:hypothetical protein